MTQFHTLVASDLDGTLLPEGQTELSCAVFDEIRRLHDCGVLFCAASGRPLDALRELFAPVADEIAYMSENAAYVCYGRELLHTIPMPRALCAELVAYLGTRTDCVSRALRQAAIILCQLLPPKRIWTRWALSLGTAVS